MVRAIDGISLDHLDGETLALVGETGSGKSVIVHSILKLLPDNALVEGEIFFKDQDLLKMSEKALSRIRGREIGVVFQNPSLALNQVYSIGRQIAEPLVIHKQMKRKASLSQAKNLLTRMRFKEAEKICTMFPFQLSGGMSQRVLIAASMIMNPKILIADEPTKGLDYRLQESVVEELNLVKEMQSSSLLLITHDLKLARKISDRIAIMYAGEIIEIAPTADFFNNPFHPYSQALMKSLPDHGFHPIPGASPSAIDPPGGCKFHPRCPLKQEICTSNKPGIVTQGGREVRCIQYC
jgi:peptide/nickel transport system ATP-binding protein